MAYVTMTTNKEGMAELNSKEVSTIESTLVEQLLGQVNFEIIVEELCQRKLKDYMEKTLDSSTRMDNSVHSCHQVRDSKMKEVCTVINKQLVFLKNLGANLKAVRHDLRSHVQNIQEQLVDREQDLLRYIDDVYDQETERVVEDITKLTQHLQDSNDLKNVSIDERLRSINVTSQAFQGLIFKPLYSIDVGMVLKENECVDYDFTCFTNLCNGMGDDTIKDEKHCERKLSDDIQGLVAQKLSQPMRSGPPTGDSASQAGGIETVTKQKCPYVESVPQLPAKSAKLQSNHAFHRRRRSSSRRGLGYMTIHRPSAKQETSSPSKPKPNLPDRPQLPPTPRKKQTENVTEKEQGCVKRRSVIERQMGVVDDGDTMGQAENNEKEIWFVETNKESSAKSVLASQTNCTQAKENQDVKKKFGITRQINVTKSEDKKTERKQQDEKVLLIKTNKQNTQAKLPLGHPMTHDNTAVAKNGKQDQGSGKGTVFVETSEENAYAKSQGMEGFLEMLRNNREKKEQEELPCTYEEVQFLKNKAGSGVKTKVASPSTDSKQKFAIKNEPPKAEQQSDEPPLPPRLYRLDDQDVNIGQKTNANNNNISNDLKSTDSPTSSPPMRPSNLQNQKVNPRLNVPEATTKKTELAVDGNNAASSARNNVSAKADVVPKSVQYPDQPVNGPHSLPRTQKQKSAATSSAAQMREMCKAALSPEVIGNIFSQGYHVLKTSSESVDGPASARRNSGQAATPPLQRHQGKSAQQLANPSRSGGITPQDSTESVDSAIFENMANWLTVPFMWEHSTFSNITSAVFLSDTRSVILDGNWLRFLTRNGNVTSRCELKQLTKGGPLRMSCSKTDSLVVASTSTKQILVVPTSGSKVKASLYTIPDVMPDFASAVDSGYVVAGKVRIKGDSKFGVAVLDNRLASKTRWHVKCRISDMCTSMNNIYVCLEENHTVVVYNLQGNKTHSFGDKQSLCRPGGICVNLNGDVIVTHKASEDDPHFKVSSWSSGGSKQMDLLVWAKTKSYPAMACQGHKLVLAGERTIACYQINY